MIEIYIFILYTCGTDNVPKFYEWDKNTEENDLDFRLQR